MPMRFTGTIEELKEKLSALAGSGEWKELNSNQWQFRNSNGGILNWFPTTGTISFQGVQEGRTALESTVGRALSGIEPSASPGPDPPAEPAWAGSGSPGVTAPPDARPVSEAGSVVPGMPVRNASQSQVDLLGQKFDRSELVVGLVGAVGTELRKVMDILAERLKVIGYETREIRVSKDIIPEAVELPADLATRGEYARIAELMDAGNRARELSGDNSILALGVAAKISVGRPEESEMPTFRPRCAYIVSSLKHPMEVERLREIYPEAFYLIGVHADEKRRHRFLTEEKRLKPDEAERLIRRDEDEHLTHGQRTTDTFHMSDFFVHLDANQDKLKHSLWRVLEILFGKPHITPTFDEFAMFMAFAASLRSADLSRQVGAVVTKDRMIIATGANDCPRYGGGLYWPEYDQETSMIVDSDDGRDYKRGEDSNKIEQQKIIEDIIEGMGDVVDRKKLRDALASKIDNQETLNNIVAAMDDLIDRAELRESLARSRIRDITEYGRVVHAEMEALLSCARSNVSSHWSTVYCTTFPCHNCAKHIIAAGVVRVIYIEPYPKSKAIEFHSDSIKLGFAEPDGTVHFEPFVGVGPRRFFDLFSMRLGSGYPIKRKDSSGLAVPWQLEGAKLRIQMIPSPYTELELVAGSMFNAFREGRRTDGRG